MKLQNYNINFTSCYKISSKENNNNVSKIYNLESEMHFNLFGQAQINTIDKGFCDTNLYVSCPDEYDFNVEKILKNNGINFHKRNFDEIRSLKEIIARVELGKEAKEDGRKLVFVNTEKFDKAFEKDEYFYIEKGEKRGFEFIKDHIDSGLPIAASYVVLSEKDNSPKVSFYDGRHRYCVMRDLGAKSTPVSLDENSIKIAQKYGILDKIAE